MVDDLTPEQRWHLPLPLRITAIRESLFPLTNWESKFLTEIQEQRYLSRKQFDQLERIERRIFYDA